ncbi:MAG TPA: YncE family protein [Spirochaetota bacterium]|nr:YncE family protein [Spirochaetota bacterium]
MKTQRNLIAQTIIVCLIAAGPATALELKKTIHGELAAKSVVHNGKGLFFAQNMMYRHTISVYNSDYQLVKTIPDTIRPSDYGYTNLKGTFRGAPVECAFSHDGQFAWISQYYTTGAGRNNPGHDKCGPSSGYDNSFLYRINTTTFAIDAIVEVGSVPKYVGTSPDNKYVIVTNWCTYDAHIIDTATNKIVKKIYLGPYPRGIVVDPTSSFAYIAVMGSYDIAIIDLKTFEKNWIKGVGRSPRHLCISPDGRYLYASLNGEAQLAKVDLLSGKNVAKVHTGSQPRSMDISTDGAFLYVVNYSSNSMSKVRTADMKVMKTVKTNGAPIGITYDGIKKEVWVSCYSGTLMVFKD